MVSHTHQRPTRSGLRHHSGERRMTCRARADGFDLDTVLPLVRREVRRFRPWRLDRDDLMQAGVAGALEAWRRRDPARGDTFVPYAQAWVRKELQQTLARGDFTMAVPAHVPQRATALRRHLDREPSLEIAGRRMGIDANQTVSLDRLLDGTPDTSLLFDAERLTSADPPVDEAVVAELDRDAVRRAVAGLAAPQRLVVSLRFGFDGGDARSTREIGRLVGVSDFTVRMQLKQATAVLRARLAALRESDRR